MDLLQAVNLLIELGGREGHAAAVLLGVEFVRVGLFLEVGERLLELERSVEAGLPELARLLDRGVENAGTILDRLLHFAGGAFLFFGELGGRVRHLIDAGRCSLGGSLDAQEVFGNRQQPPDCTADGTSDGLEYRRHGTEHAADRAADCFKRRAEPGELNERRYATRHPLDCLTKRVADHFANARERRRDDRHHAAQRVSQCGGIRCDCTDRRERNKELRNLNGSVTEPCQEPKEPFVQRLQCLRHGLHNRRKRLEDGTDDAAKVAKPCPDELNHSPDLRQHGFENLTDRVNHRRDARRDFCETARDTFA